MKRMEHHYVKTILYAYPKLGALIEAVEISVENQARLSFKRDTLSCVAMMVGDIERTRVLRELKSCVEGVLSELSREELYLLEYKYFRRKRRLMGEFAGMNFDGSEREYYRRQNGLLKKLAFRLAQRGVTRARFFEEIMPIPPFERVYKAVEEGREFGVVKKRSMRDIHLKIPPVDGGASSP